MPSSVIAHTNYDLNTHTLRVVFVSGVVYDYMNVPESTYKAMKSAFSKGTFLNKEIKGKYTFKKLST